MSRWFAPALVFLSVIVSGVVVRGLPDPVALPFHRLLPFAADGDVELASRYAVGFALPIAAALITVLFKALKSRRGERVSKALFARMAPPETLEASAILKFEPSYDTVTSLPVAFIVAFHFAVLALASGAGEWAPILFGVVTGAALIAAGNVMPRSRPNAVVGIRTAATMSNVGIWMRVHRVFGLLLVLAGMATIGTSIVAPRYSLTCAILGMLITCLIMVLYVSSAKNRLLAWPQGGT
jgi:hypothetical protein